MVQMVDLGRYVDSACSPRVDRTCLVRTRESAESTPFGQAEVTPQLRASSNVGRGGLLRAQRWAAMAAHAGLS